MNEQNEEKEKGKEKEKRRKKGKKKRRKRRTRKVRKVSQQKRNAGDKWYFVFSSLSQPHLFFLSPSPTSQLHKHHCTTSPKTNTYSLSLLAHLSPHEHNASVTHPSKTKAQTNNFQRDDNVPLSPFLLSLSLALLSTIILVFFCCCFLCIFPRALDGRGFTPNLKLREKKNFVLP